MSEAEDVVAAPVEPTVPRRQGFLPIETNAFDRVFIGVVVFVAIHLLWMRFIEPQGVPLWVATLISLVVGGVIFKRG